jgi:hypothetical protein
MKRVHNIESLIVKVDEPGPSMLRWTDGTEWYLAIIHASGIWESLSLPRNLN